VYFVVNFGWFVWIRLLFLGFEAALTFDPLDPIEDTLWRNPGVCSSKTFISTEERNT